jgi:hypothetical protein
MQEKFWREMFWKEKFWRGNVLKRTYLEDSERDRSTTLRRIFRGSVRVEGEWN